MQLRLTTLSENTAGMIGYTGEWGLSILVEVGGEAVLLDAGFSDSVIRNAVVGNVNLSKINKIVLSHGHTDHTGGLRSLLQVLKKKIDIYAHPDMWESKYASFSLPGSDAKSYRYIGVPYCREELEGLRASFILSREPVWLNERVVTTGEVSMETPFEQVDDNMFVREKDGFVPDRMADDQGLIIKTAQGLVLVLGCAHRGVVNTMIHARRVTGIENIYAVIGGTHLIRAGAEQISKTVVAFRQFGVQKIGVSHCTGMAAAAVLAREFGDIFFFNNAGSVINL